MIKKFSSSLKELKSIRNIALCALFVALYVALNGVSFIVGSYKLTVAYIAIAALGLFFGPVTAPLAAGAADFLGFLVRQDGPYHPGLMLSLMLTAFVFGLILYKSPLTFWRALLARGIINIFINIGLNTLWMSNILGKGYFVILGDRTIKNLVLLIPESIIIYTTLLLIKKAHERLYRSTNL